jgi:hypothetical protein
MVLSLNILELITSITSWNKKYYIKNTFIIPLNYL